VGEESDDTSGMSVVGNPLETSLVQAAQAQQIASKTRDKEKAATDSARRFQDLVELRIAGVESPEAIRKLPHNDSEQAESEAHPELPPRHDDDDDNDATHVDVTA